MTDEKKLTTNAGAPVADNQNVDDRRAARAACCCRTSGSWRSSPTSTAR